MRPPLFLSRIRLIRIQSVHLTVIMNDKYVSKLKIYIDKMFL